MPSPKRKKEKATKIPTVKSPDPDSHVCCFSYKEALAKLRLNCAPEEAKHSPAQLFLQSRGAK